MVSTKAKLYEARKNLRKDYDKGNISEKEFREERTRLTDALEAEKAESLERYEKERPIQSVTVENKSLAAPSTAPVSQGLLYTPVYEEPSYSSAYAETPVIKPQPKPFIQPSSKEKFTKADEDRQRRVEAVIEREKRLETFKQAIYERTGTESKQGDSYLVGFGKSLARTPVEIATMPLFIGGRVGLTGEALTTKQGRTELTRAAKATPKAVVQSFDVRKPEGLVNLGFAVLGVKALGKARAQTRAAQKGFEVSTEQGFTKRTTQFNEPQREVIIKKQKGQLKVKENRPISVKDITKVNVEGLVGKKVYKGEAQVTTKFYKGEEGAFVYKGKGEAKIGSAKTKIQTKGLAKEGESVGYTRTTTKGKVSEYGSISKSERLVSEPMDITRSETIIGKVGKKGVEGGQVSIGYEIEVLRKKMGATKERQLFKTFRAGIGDQTINKFYKRTPKAEPFIGELGTRQGTILQTRTAPRPQTIRLLSELKEQVAKTAIKSELKSARQTTISGLAKTISQQKLRVSEPVQEQKQATKQKTMQMTVQAQEKKTLIEELRKPKEELRAIRKPITKPAQETKSKVPIPMPPETIQAQITEQTPVQETFTPPVQIPGKPLIPPREVPLIPKTPPPFVFLPPVRLGLSPSSTKSTTFSGFRRPTQYAPSLLGIAQGKQATRTSNLSGLEIRGIPAGFKEESRKTLSFGSSKLIPQKDGISMKFKVERPKKKKKGTIGQDLMKRMKTMKVRM